MSEKLEVKEPIVLDQSGRPITSPQDRSGGDGRIYVWKTGGWLLPLIGFIAIPILLLGGIAAGGFLMALGIVALVVRKLKMALR